MRPALFLAVVSMAASVQVVALSLRSMGFALVGASAMADALLAASSLFGVALGAWLRPAPMRAAGWSVGAAALVFLLAATGGVPDAIGGLPVALRLALAAVVMALAVAPIGAMLPSLSARAAAPVPIYVGDLVGAAAGVLVGGALAAALGVAVLSGCAAGLAIVAALLLRGASTVVVSAERARATREITAAAAIAFAMGGVEVALPKLLSASTGAAEWVLPAVLFGVLLGGASGVLIRAYIDAERALLLAAATGLVLVLVDDSAADALFFMLSDVESSALLRLTEGTLLVAALAALPAAASGAAFAGALTRGASVRKLTALSALFAGLGALAAALLSDLAPPRFIIGVAFATLALGALAEAAQRRAWPIAFAALLVSASLIFVGARPAERRFATSDLSRAILRGDRAPGASLARIVADGHDASGRVVVAELDDRTLFRDGKADASLAADIDTQTFLGLLPLFYRPNAERALVVGLGLGATARTVRALGVPEVEVVEFSPRVIEANPDLPEGVRVIQDEARAHLATARGYDFITAEPTNLFVAGMPRLVSVEALRAMKRALKPGGVVVLWSHAYLSSDEIANTLIRTAREVFDHVDVFSGTTSDYFLVLRSMGTDVDLLGLEASTEQEALSCALAAVDHVSTQGLLTRQVQRPVPDGPIESDLQPRLPAMATRALLERTFVSLPKRAQAEEAREAFVALVRETPLERVNDLVGPVNQRLALGPLSAREVTALLRTRAGVRVVQSVDDLPMAPDRFDPPWAMPLLLAAIPTLTKREVSAEAYETLALSLSASAQCVPEATWSSVFRLFDLAARYDKTKAPALAAAIARAETPEHRTRRLRLASSLCLAAAADCCPRYAARLQALGDITPVCELELGGEVYGTPGDDE